RDEITMTAAEIAAFLEDQRVVVCATNGPRGWPHLMPLWYVVRGADIWAWTYAKSQKARNLERDPRATLELEDGDRYEDLRGVMVEAHTTLHRDLEVVTELGVEILARYTATAEVELLEGVRRQAGKRVAMQFVPERTASWDHRKLGGTY
ncbi:MAG TPA: pyridoxamine 5'-phosphate oxidase family protein, partial [Solirubrobacteraceae bacterium]|nr:pyridoxamine 5'-phosphate oxidase family protein [Solirubrobacteraceae bacterium]